MTSRQTLKDPRICEILEELVVNLVSSDLQRDEAISKAEDDIMEYMELMVKAGIRDSKKPPLVEGEKFSDYLARLSREQLLRRIKGEEQP